MPIQETIISGYTLIEDEKLFDNREFREAPYPFPDRLAIAIKQMKRLNMLPCQFQAPAVRLESSDGAFITSNEVDTLTGKYRYHDRVPTSRNQAREAQHAMGEYTSPVYTSSRPFVMIPPIGYLGHEGLSLKLVGVTDGEVVELKPAAPHSKDAQTCTEEIVRAPSNGFRLVASDKGKPLFFNMASPGSVGGLTYYAQKLLRASEYTWEFSRLFLVFFLRRGFFRPMRVSNPS